MIRRINFNDTIYPYQQAGRAKQTHHFLCYLPLFFFLLLSGCAKLPDYASPHFSAVPFNDKLDYIEYRPLKVEDFRAKSPPTSIKGNEQRINAHTSISLRSSSPIHYTISHPNETFGLYKARLQQLTFKAVMMSMYSWWNPRLQKDKTSYVLQHEQIHFALTEIAARELNRKLQFITQKTFSGPEKEDVQQQLLATVQKEIDSSKNELLKEHTHFDEETSLHFDPYTQQKWFNRCQSELSRLSKWAK